jgi:hypothetical protein
MKLVNTGRQTINMERVDFWVWGNVGDDESADVILHFGDHALALDVEESDMFWRQVCERR